MSCIKCMCVFSINTFQLSTATKTTEPLNREILTPSEFANNREDSDLTITSKPSSLYQSVNKMPLCQSIKNKISVSPNI